MTGEGYLDAGDTPAWRGVYEAAADVVGAHAARRRADHGGQGAPRIRSHRRAASRRARHAAGFCVFNDCGVAVEMLRRNHGLKRIAYVDIDAHHGDGMYYGFESDPGSDLRRHPRGRPPSLSGHGRAEEIGRGAAAGTKLNIPVPPGADDAVFDAEWPRVLAHLRKYKPEFILLQAGADSIEGDPITHMRFTAETHTRAARDLAALAEELGHGRVLGTGRRRLQPHQPCAGLVRGRAGICRYRPGPGGSHAKHN